MIIKVILFLLFIGCILGSILLIIKHRENVNIPLKIQSDIKSSRPILLTDMEYKQYDKFPIYKKEGIILLKLPPTLRSSLTNMWLKNRKTRQIEEKNQYVITNEGKSPTYMVNIDKNLCKEIENFVLKELINWLGIKNLIHTATYGIREYSRNSILNLHVDRPETHVFSAIINVGQIGIDEPWALTVQNRFSSPKDIIFENGFDVALYESSTLVHGRPKPLKGEVYANMFIHYSSNDWKKQIKGIKM